MCSFDVGGEVCLVVWLGVFRYGEVIVVCGWGFGVIGFFFGFAVLEELFPGVGVDLLWGESSECAVWVVMVVSVDDAADDLVSGLEVEVA